MSVTLIDHVEQAPLWENLHGASLERPKPGDTSDIYSFAVHGWAVGRSTPVESVQVLDDDRLLLDASLNVVRPDVASKFSLADGETKTGFHVVIRTLEARPEFELVVRVKLRDGTTSPVAEIRGRRHGLPASPPEGIQPVMLTTLGRSGSKWLAWLLSCHRDVVAFNPLVFEPRVATYWMTVLRALAAPASYFRQIHTENWQQRRWWLGEGEKPLPAPVGPPLADWLGRDAVESLAAICQSRVEAFYAQVAKADGTSAPRYFVEKFLLEPVVLELVSEVYPGARELILVRDFRDRLSSVLAWNEQRGDYGFGRDPSMTDAEYVTGRMRKDANALLRRWRERAAVAHLVRYEDLILKPAQTLGELLRYLEIDSSDETVEAMLLRASQETSLLNAHRTVNDPTASIGRWQNDLPAELAELCDDVLGQALKAFGYSLAAESAPDSR
jgi:hypothetical protein